MKKSNVYESEPLMCDVCGKDLFKDPGMSIIVFIEDMDRNAINDIKFCCKGNCDRKLKASIKKGELDGWKELSEFINPYLYLKNIMAVLNRTHEGLIIEDLAYEKYKDLILNCYPYICRNLEPNELRAAENAEMFPF